MNIRTSWPWLVALAAMVCFIWGNSLVPGSESGSISGAFVTFFRNALAGAGLPYEWVTNFIVRKTAHFIEYLVLALVAMQALRPHREPRTVLRAVGTALFLVAVPSCDETIQLFVGDRSGQLRDVLIDCSGAACGALLTLLVSRLRGRKCRGGRA